MRRFTLIVFVLSVTCSAGEAFGVEFWRFDMGTADSELRTGFTRVTAGMVYKPESHFGWKSSDDLKEQHKFYERQWQYNESRGREQPPPIYTNELTCDSIYSVVANSFLVDLPPGDYMVWMLFGRSAGSTREYHEFDVTIPGGDPARCEVEIPGPYRFERRVVRASVGESPLSIELSPRSDWGLSAVVIFAAADEATARSQFLDALESELDFLPPDVAEKWQETKHVDDRAMPDFSERDRERGYAVFARHWSEVIYPNTVPLADELDPQLDIFAAWGEHEPATVTVLPLENLPGARLIAHDLRMGDAVIPAANIDVRSVRYMRVRPNYSSYFSYHVAPDVLEHKQSVDLRRGENHRFWVTVHVPEEAPAGIYSGHLRFSVQGATPTDIPLRLRVLPIRLAKDPRYIYGMYYRDPLSNIHPSNGEAANDYFTRKAEWERQDMVAHGMNSHISGISGLTRGDDGNWSMDGAETESRIALDRKYGLTDYPLVVSFPVGWWYSKLVEAKGLGSHLRLVRTDVPDSFFDEVTKMVEAIEREKQKYDWPEFLYYPIDEPSTQAASVDFMVKVLQAIKRVPGVRTYVTADPSHEQFEPMWPYVDVWCCQPFVFSAEKIRQLSEQRGVEFWCYPNHISGENDHTPVRGARMTWGFGLWQSGFRALMPWIYQASAGDPWNYLDGSSMDFFNRSTAEGKPIPVTLWEAYREGIDDSRYLYTLLQQIQQAKGRDEAARAIAVKAEQEVAFIAESFERQEKYKYDDLWSGRDFDAFRWLLAAKILELQAAR